MRRLIWSLASMRDLAGIEAFIGSDSPAAALRGIRAVRERAEQLHGHPSSGPALRGDLRYLAIRSAPYLLIYRIIEDRVEIVRVRHAREDWRPE